MLTKKYEYVHYDRETKKSGRSYLVGEKKLPSVTTILNASKDTSWLKKWQEKVGIEEAERIKNEASLIGSEMHKYLEYYVQDKRYESTTNEGQQARKMALEIVKRGFKPITEIWGTEVSLHHTDKYAGATDLVCLYKGRPVIVDFKQTNKPCQEHYSKVQDYYTQLAAYGEAHTSQYGPIEGGVILMCSRDLVFQSFEIFDDKYERYKEDWWKKYDHFITTSEQPPQESEQKDETLSSENEQSSHQQSPQ